MQLRKNTYRWPCLKGKPEPVSLANSHIGEIASCESAIHTHRATLVSIPSQAGMNLPHCTLWYKSASRVQQFTVCSPRTKTVLVGQSG